MKRPDGSSFAAVVPFALAIFTFGVIYGTVARRTAEPLAVLLSSVLIFSGALQFTIVGLILAGAQAGALIAAALTLNARHVLLGAVLRPRIQESALKRAGLAWFLVDETTGLALNARNPAVTLLVSGSACYIAWIGGIAAGIAGASIDALRSAATAIFPVLFVGLASMSCTSRSLAVRAAVAAPLTVALALAWPGGRGLAPVLAAVIAAAPGTTRA